MANLDCLYLSLNKLDFAAMAQLVWGAWPLLKTYNPRLDAAASKLLSTADWPDLTSLDLRQIKLNTTCSHELVQIPLSNLETLNSPDTGMNSQAIAVLVRANWLQLPPVAFIGPITGRAWRRSKSSVGACFISTARVNAT